MNNSFYCIVLLLLSYATDCINNDIYKIIFYNAQVPRNVELRKRILTTVCCSDCDTLPKVENAGKQINIDAYNCQIMHNGIKVITDCYYGHWMTVLIELLKGHHEPQEEKVFYEVLKYIPTGATMIEVGSYWGYYSMWFQKQVQNSKNYLIEPDPNNMAIGKNNFSLNCFEGHFIDAMVGSHSADNRIFVDWDYNEHTVKQISIDDFALEHDINYIHILHSDIQGAEIEMLEGCKRLISEKRIAYFFISTHRGTHQKCLDILENSGLVIMISISRQESFSADGLIVAKLPDAKGPSSLEISRRTAQFSNVIDWIVDDKK